MSDEKTIVVLGATGGQGGGAARALLDDPARRFRVRAVTRDTGSDRARALAERGAEVVQADLDDEASLRDAFAGAHGAFVVTNYWAPHEPGDERTAGRRELDQAGNAARAAHAAGLAHVIWSTLEDTRPVLGALDDVPEVEGFTVPHFDAKADADRLFHEQDVPTTLLRTTFFFENIAGGVGLARAADGRLVFTLPLSDRPLSGIAVDDIGRAALAIFTRGPEAAGPVVSIAGDRLTGAGYADALADALGEPVEYRPLSWAEFRAFDRPGSVEMANMFQFYAEDSDRLAADRDLTELRRLVPGLQSFPAWLDAHRDALPRL